MGNRLPSWENPLIAERRTLLLEEVGLVCFLAVTLLLFPVLTVLTNVKLLLSSGVHTEVAPTSPLGHAKVHLAGPHLCRV